MPRFGQDFHLGVRDEPAELRRGSNRLLHGAAAAEQRQHRRPDLAEGIVGRAGLERDPGAICADSGDDRLCGSGERPAAGYSA